MLIFFHRLILLVYGLALVAVVMMADTQWGVALWSFISAVPSGDKIGHFLLFGVLGFLVNSYAGRSGCSAMGHIKVTLLVSLVVLLEELSQIYLPHRNFDVFDIVSDLAGIGLFSAFAYWRMRGRLTA